MGICFSTNFSCVLTIFRSIDHWLERIWNFSETFTQRICDILVTQYTPTYVVGSKLYSYIVNTLVSLLVHKMVYTDVHNIAKAGWFSFQADLAQFIYQSCSHNVAIYTNHTPILTFKPHQLVLMFTHHLPSKLSCMLF